MTNKFQDKILNAVMDYAQVYHSQEGVHEAWQHLEFLISQAVPIETLKLVCQEFERTNAVRSDIHPINYDPQYWIDLAEKENE